MSVCSCGVKFVSCVDCLFGESDGRVGRQGGQPPPCLSPEALSRCVSQVGQADWAGVCVLRVNQQGSARWILDGARGGGKPPTGCTVSGFFVTHGCTVSGFFGEPMGAVSVLTMWELPTPAEEVLAYKGRAVTLAPCVAAASGRNSFSGALASCWWPERSRRSAQVVAPRC